MSSSRSGWGGRRHRKAAQVRGIAVVEDVEGLGLAGCHLTQELQLLGRADVRRDSGWCG